MNWKSTWILLTAALVFFGYIWFVEEPIHRERMKEASHFVLHGFDPAAITSVSIKPRKADEILAVRVDQTTNQWQLTQPIQYPALNDPINGLLQALPELKWQERISASELANEPNAQEKFGFAEPQFEVALQTAQGSQKILIGQSAAFSDEVYLEVVGNPDIYLVNSPVLKLIPADKDQWRDRSVMDLTGLDYQSIRARSGDGLIELERNSTNHLWFLTSPIKARADTDGVNRLLANLQKMQVRRFVSDSTKPDLESYGLLPAPQRPDLDLSFYRGTNLVAALQMGASPSNQPALAFARRQSPANVMAVDRDPLRSWQANYTNFLDYHFISVPPESIARITVAGEGRFSVEKQTNNVWIVHAETNFPADAGLMNEWLASFTNIPTQIEKTVATDLQPYGLTRPVLQFVLQAAGTNGPSNAVIARIDFGATRNDRVFERRPDEPSVNLISAEDFGRLPHAAWQLRDRRIWSFDTNDVASLTIHQLGATRKYLRTPAGDWTFAPGYHGPPIVNWPSLEEGVHRMGNLHAVYWSGLSDSLWQQLGFDKADLSLTFELKRDGRTEMRTIQFGGRSPYSYPYASVVEDGRRLFFEFPVDFYENFVDHDMTIPAAWRYHQ